MIVGGIIVGVCLLVVGACALLAARHVHDESHRGRW